MKIRYEAASPQNPQPRYFLFAQSQDEVRFCTILRDLLSGKPRARIRFVGADPLGKDLPGITPNPVQSIGLAIEDPDAVLPGSPQALERSLDPTFMVPPPPLPADGQKPKRKAYRASPGGGTHVSL